MRLDQMNCSKVLNIEKKDKLGQIDEAALSQATITGFSNGLQFIVC